MSWVKHYYSEWLEKLELFEEADSLMVLTSCEIEPFSECEWSYEFYSEIDGEYTLIKEESEREPICECLECKEFGDDLYEYFSIFKALDSIDDSFGDVQYSLHTSCEKFSNDAAENVFGNYKEIYQCPFLKTLGEGLSRLLLNVHIHYRSLETEEGAPF